MIKNDKLKEIWLYEQDKTLSAEYELTKSAGIDINRITNGASVTQSRETSISGVFACGNVLHVHDLVDYVSEEAEIAGKNAALYINGELKNEVDIPIDTDGKVRYTVPHRITEKKDTKVFFRVANVYENAEIKVYSGDEVIFKTRKPKVAPGEMQCITLKEQPLENAEKLNIGLEVL